MACCSGAIAAQIESAKQSATKKVEELKVKFTEMAAQGGEINIEPVKKDVKMQLAMMEDYANNPSKLLGCVPCGCCLPLGELGNVFRELAASFAGIVTVFTNGAIDTLVGFMNAVIRNLRGAVANLQSSYESLKDAGPLFSSIQAGLSDPSKKATALADLIAFRQRAALDKTSQTVGSVVEEMNKIATSPKLKEVMDVIGKLAIFIGEAPGKIRKAVQSTLSALSIIPCLSSMLGGAQQMLDSLEGFDQMFNADAVNKILKYASANKGVSPSSITGPISGLDSLLVQAEKMLK
mmetsp:Transcript_22740/g.67009  ORF Transcript_22740/g.67009 Transcript_22740/m.67009 type:complete len:293 (+) Transcript_22740:97-975(+)